MFQKVRKFVMIAALASIVASCGSYKTNLTYFSDLKDTPSGEMAIVIPQLTIVPDDQLLINVLSLNPEATASYNMPAINPSTPGTAELVTAIQQSTYIVDSKGNINFPILGSIHVEGMTTEQLQTYLTEKISKDVIDPLVRVQLLNFHVQVMGEVTQPGTLEVTGERFTILDAIAGAGDLTPYGQRENVLLVRQENGVNKFYHVNLNDSGLLSSPLYYLKQNDVVIVEPNNVKKANSRYNQDNAFKLSVISTIVSAASVVASLAIALAVK